MKSPEDEITRPGASTEPADSQHDGSSPWKGVLAFTTPRQIAVMVCAVATAAVVAAGKTVYTVLLGKIFDVVSKYGADLLGGEELLAQISPWCGYLAVLGVGMWLLSSMDLALWIISGALRAQTARKTLFSTLIEKEMDWFDSRQDGMSSLVIQTQGRVRDLQIAASQALGFLVYDTLVFVACLLVAFYFSWKLTLVVLSTCIPSVIILFLISRLIDPAIKKQKQELAKASKHASAAITAIDLVKVYNGENQELWQYQEVIARAAKHYFRQALCNCAQMGYIKLWMNMLFVVGFCFAVVLADQGGLTPGNALTTFYAALTAFQALEAVGPHWLILAKGLAAGRSLKALVTDVTPALGAQPRHPPSGYRPLHCDGDVELRCVSFAYPSNPSRLVVAPTTMFFPAGDVTFIVGCSGSGKSTLGNLLVRFYEPTSGQLRLDGTPLERLDVNWLRSNVTLIQQSSNLFNDSLGNNVALGSRHLSTVTDIDIQKACGIALLQSTIIGLPQGLDTMVGPGGYNLSGGQKQRVALARAKLRDPPVLILDEVTSGLDPANRSLIVDAIRWWRRGKTTIIITHEVAQIEDNEYVYVMDNGKLVQEGYRHGLATSKGGLFASLLSAADENDSSSDKSDATSTDNEGSHEETGDVEKVLLQRSDIQLPERAHVYDSRFSRLFLGLNDNDTQTVPFHSRVSVGVATTTAMKMRMKKQFDSTPIGGLIEAQEHPDSGRSSMEIVRNSGLAVRNSRLTMSTIPRGERVQSQLPITTRIQSQDSFLAFVQDSLLKKKAGKGDESQEQKTPPLSAILRTVWPTLDKKARVQLALGLLLCLITAGCQPAFSILFAQLLGSFWAKGSHQADGRIWGIYLTIVAAVEAISTFLAYLLMERVGQVWVNTLRTEAFSRILSQPKAWFDKTNHSPGRITECLDWSAEEMRKLVGLFVPIMVIVTFMVGSSLAWAMVIRWDLTLVALAGLPVAVIGARANSKVSDKWESICNTAADKTSAIFTEAFSNIRVVRALTLERFFGKKHDKSVEEAYRLGKRRATYAGFYYGLYQSIPFFITALVFYYGTTLLRNGKMQVTDELKVINLLLFSMGNSTLLLGNIPQLAAAKTTALQMLYYAHLSHSAGHEHAGTKRTATPLPVRMTNLRFAYPGRPTVPVLRNLTLRIDPGTSTAIVGASGCGKSTIAALLLRLYEPDSSPPPLLYHIPSTTHRHSKTSFPLTFASRPAPSLSTSHLRNHCALVPQHPFLFPGNLRQNILYGLPPSSIHISNLHHAACLAGLTTFIASLPEGYNTLLGEGSGLTLSGGQMQRVAIARALVRRPALLVLDEPTSALDAGAAEEIRGVVRGLVRGGGTGMAVVVVTHSKEMMKVVDRIAVVEEGRVVETGRYEELVGRGGCFARLVGGGGWVVGEKKRQMRRRKTGLEKETEAEIDEVDVGENNEYYGGVGCRVVNEEALRRLEGRSARSAKRGRSRDRSVE